MMNEYLVELFIDSGDGENIKLSSLTEKDKEQWIKDVEERALSEYYNKKIRIICHKFD